MDKTKKLTVIFICVFAIVLAACGKTETPDIGGKAIAELPAEMIKGQTYEVDAISGATITSNGMKDAVARCLEQASN